LQMTSSSGPSEPDYDFLDAVPELSQISGGFPQYFILFTVKDKCQHAIARRDAARTGTEMRFKALETSFDFISGSMAGGLGFEPRLAESESAVLPLDDPPTGST